jgi:hypothetical protein
MGVLLPLACMVLVASCSPKKPVSPGASSAIEAAPAPDDFTLRVVFEGLTPFWAPNKDPNPGRIVFLMGPQNPSGLPVGGDMPQHLTHMLIRTTGQEEITPAGRTLSAIHGFQHGDVTLSDDFMATTLEGEDIALSGDILTALNVRGLSEVTNLPQALDNLSGGTVDDKTVKECLTGDTVSCADFAPQLTARFVLKNGTFSPGAFFSNGAKFVLANSRALSAPKPVARSIVAELKVHGPLVLKSHSLIDNSEQGSVTIRGHLGRTVEVHIVSHPNCADALECRQRFRGSDFLFNYALLKNPLFIQVADLPLPTDPAALQVRSVRLDTPVFNVQCSPVSLTR